MLVDVHAHLDYEGYSEPIAEIVRKAKTAGLSCIINCGLNPKSNRVTLALSKSYDIVKPAFGFYPTDAEKASDTEIDSEIAWIRQNKPFAISEIGMDGKYGKDMARQTLVFRKMLDLARGLDLPVIIHTRQAEEQCFQLIEESKCRNVVLHCFTGSPQLAQRGIKNKWAFSIPPCVAYSKGFQGLVERLELNHILTETDSPFLAPKPGQQNRPENVVITIAKIAEIKRLTPEEVKKIVFLNFRRIFG